MMLKAGDGIDAEAEGHYRDLAGLGSTMGLHTHDFFEFFLVLEGTVYHCVNGQRELLNEGTLVFMRPQDYHYYDPVPGADFRLINLSFYERTVMELFSFLGEGFPKNTFLTALNPVAVQLSNPEMRMLHRRMEKLYRIPQNEKQWFRTELRALLTEVYTHYLMPSVVSESDEKPSWFVTLCQKMKNPELFVEGVPAMIRLSGKSHAHLCRSFKKWEQQTPLQYVTRLRLQYAENLLLHSDKGVLDIALEAGYGNAGHFYKSFKALFGRTPQSHRKWYGANHTPLV
jgi:AraC family cel operon transcriptional repressor